MSFADSIRESRKKPKKTKKKKEPTHSVQYDLVKAITTSTVESFEKGINTARAIGWHPSQLESMCPRYEVLRQLVPEELDMGIVVPDMRTQLIFDVGTAIHEWIQNQYLGPMGKLKGTWVCTQTGHTVEDSVMPSTPYKGKRKIAIGNNHFWRYGELSLENKDWGIVGHTDGIYILGQGTKDEEEVVLEIKTAGPYFWNAGAKAPLQSNLFQINLYMWLLGKKKGVLLYVDKAGVYKDGPPFKEFIVEYSEIPRKDACEKIEIYRACVQRKEMPHMLTHCEHQPTGARARQCPLRKVCQDLSFVAQLEKVWGPVKYL
jgi:hypothetical protein